jgi:hypothetical protein
VARLPAVRHCSDHLPSAGQNYLKHRVGEPKDLWQQLASSQKASLRRLTYEMQRGDVIYVKQGPVIVDKGIITGGYKFDSQFRLIDPYGVPWAHQVTVDWSRGKALSGVTRIVFVKPAQSGV